MALHDKVGGDETGGNPADGDTGGLEILVMDDEEMIRELTATILGHLGYRVTTCCHGEEAISLFDGAREAGMPFFAVILDLTIPNRMGGKEAAQRILALDPSARLIVSTGYSDDPVASHFREHGFCATLAKPYLVDDLVRTLEALQAPSV